MAKPKQKSPKKTTSKQPVKEQTKDKVKPKTSKGFLKCPKIKISEKIKPAFRIVGTVVLVLTSLVLVDLLVQYINNDISVAMVNGHRISKAQWHKRLEQTSGSMVASQMIDEKIIKLEAKKAEISVSKEEIQKEMDEIIESIGGDDAFKAALLSANITEQELRDQIKTDLLTKEILIPTFEYDDEDLISFFDSYSDVIFPEETAELEEGEKLDFEQYREKTEEVYIEQEVQMRRAGWMAEKKEEYNIQDNSVAKPKYGFLSITFNMVSNLIEKVNKTEVEVEAEK